MKTLIKNGRIVTAVDDYMANILIEDEQISVIGKSNICTISTNSTKKGLTDLVTKLVSWSSSIAN